MSRIFWSMCLFVRCFLAPTLCAISVLPHMTDQDLDNLYPDLPLSNVVQDLCMDVKDPSLGNAPYIMHIRRLPSDKMS